MSSPTARTLDLLRAEGWTCQVVESWIPRLNIRRDLFGVADVLAAKPGEAVLLVQCTSTANMASRIGKAKNEPRLRTWLACGQRFEVWGWDKRGGQRGRWECRRVPLVLDDLRNVAAAIPPRRKRINAEPSLFAARMPQDARGEGRMTHEPSEATERATSGGRPGDGQCQIACPSVQPTDHVEVF